VSERQAPAPVAEGTRRKLDRFRTGLPRFLEEFLPALAIGHNGPVGLFERLP